MALDSKNVPASIKVLCAAFGGVASTMVCYPLDLLKLNMQIAGEGGTARAQVTTTDFIKHIVKRDGIKGLYAGLTASMLRQALYTGGRLGTFQILLDQHPNEPPSFLIKLLYGFLAGAVGGLAGLPPDVALTRMAVEKSLPEEKRRRYTHVFNALYRIQKEEGASTLFRGLTPTLLRAMVVNMTQMASYVQFKQFLIANNITGDNSFCHLTSSLFSSFIATTCSLPIDIAKTRMQNMRIINGVPEYSNTFQVWYLLVKKEGVLSLWKGFTPLLIRNGSQYLVLFFVYESLMSHYKTVHK